ncbi:MAG TPA: protein kinase [Thermoleophilaceae bacterium]|nr:protein kinase [Thermoleophilaceae bacterium]
MNELPIGALFAGHRIEAVVGRGGMGVVYVAMHQRLKQRRALKVIAPEYCRDEQFRRRFEREWEVAAAIDHPHVIPIYDAGEDQDQLYIAMRYVDGVDLRSLIVRDGRLAPPFTADVVGQIASALEAAHARGLVHRDVKPANILIAETSDGPFAYLTDFGLTKGVSAETSGITKTGVFVGTLDYIAPEQLDGVATSRSDIYALGCLTYHALSGEVPYPQPTAPAKMWAHIHSPPPHLTVGSPAISDAVARAMAKNPNDRFASAGEFGAALNAAVGAADLPAAESAAPDIGPATVSGERPILDALPIATPAEATSEGQERRALAEPPGNPRPASRRPIAALIALAVLLLGGVAAAVISSSGGDDEKGATNAAHKSPKEGKKRIVFRTHPFGPVPRPTEPIDQSASRLGAARGLANVRSVSFGSGGIVEYSKTDPADIWNYAVALDRSGKYVTADKSVGYPAIGDPRTDFSVPDAVAVKFVRALRNKDCDAYQSSAETKSDGREACAKDFKTEYARARSDFGKVRDVDVFRLGGTHRLAFYGVRAGNSYRTLTLENPRGLDAEEGGRYTTGFLVIRLFPRQGVRVNAPPS